MIRVLVVEDQPVVAEAHVAYVSRVSGFVVAGQCRTGADALRLLAKEDITLVLLDMYLPDMHGLDVVRAMRAAGHSADVIALTRARDLAVVRAAVSFGIIHYLIKPFPFQTLRDKLEQYRTYRSQLAAPEQGLTQPEVDRLLTGLRGARIGDPPKGMSQDSLDAVVATLRDAGPTTGLAAAEVAAALGASRVTARRYLEYLAELGLVSRRSRYGRAHRPEVEYRWRETDGHGTDPPRSSRIQDP